MNVLEAGLEKLDIHLSEEQLAKLDGYADCVLEFNKTYNLMKADDKDALFTSHVLDSLAPYSFLKQLFEERRAVSAGNLTAGDIGSGGGCPGIPLGIVFSDVKFVLVERMEKRCDFLESVVQKLKLENVTVMRTQAEAAGKNLFDVEVFRAFHPFDKKICGLLTGMLKSGGYLAAYKARAEKIAEEMEGVKNIFPEYTVHKLQVPGLEDHERNLVVVQKK